ncbi:MAG: DUF2059 domain-containing protein [Chitinophagaceae bacterium]
MKKLVLVAGALIACSIVCQAQMTPKKAAIKEMFNVMHQDSLMKKTMNEMTIAMAASYKNQDPNNSPGENSMEKILERNKEATQGIITKMINEDMVDIYDKHFTLEEIKDFTIFYKSKSGQQLLNKTPDITRDMMSTMMTKYMPAMRQAMMSPGKSQ